MQNKKIKNIISLLLSVTALTRSNLVNAFPPDTTSKPQLTNPTVKSIPSTPSRSRQIEKKSGGTSTALTKNPKQQIAITNSVDIKLLPTISSRAKIPFTFKENKVDIPIFLQDSTIQVMLYSLNPTAQKYDLQFTWTTKPHSEVTIPIERLSCAQEYIAFITIPHNPKTPSFGVFTSEDHSSDSKAEKKLLTSPPTLSKSTSQALTANSTSAILATPRKRYEVIGTLNITPTYIAKQQALTKTQDLSKCLTTYESWHKQKTSSNQLINDYTPLAIDPANFDYTIHPNYKQYTEYKQNTAEFEKISCVVKILAFMKEPNVSENQTLIEQAINETIEDEKDKSMLKTLLTKTVAYHKSKTIATQKKSHA